MKRFPRRLTARWKTAAMAALMLLSVWSLPLPAGAETGTQNGTEYATQNGAETGTETGAETGTETATQAETEIETTTGMEIAAEALAGRTKHTITVDPGTVIQQDFLGVGVNVIPAALMQGQTSLGYTEAHWEMDSKRIRTVQPKVARVWFQIDWMEPEKGVYTWDSPKMKAFYKYLDAFKAAGTEIELNFGWKVGSAVHDWFPFPGIDPVESAPLDLDAYAASASALLRELIERRGYDNVKYMTFYNEPNGSWDFDVPGDGSVDEQAYYAEMVRKTSERLKRDGLRDRIEIWGPEETGAPSWTRYMKEHVDDAIDGYSFHVYGESYTGLGEAFATRQQYVGGKPLHLTEFGWADDNASSWDAGYANSVIQAANMGVKSALMWQLNGVWTHDPNGGTNGTYTMWDSLLLGLTPRKTFYSAGMLNRYVPEHSQVLKVDTGGSEELRAAAFRSRDGHYTVLVEAKAGSPKELKLNFAGKPINKTFRKVAYRDDIVREANAILPPVSGTFRAGSSFTDQGITGDYNVIIYTTTPVQTQVKISPIDPVVNGGDKIRLNAEVIDGRSGVIWSVIEKNGGTINKFTGLYHAPRVKDETLIAVKATSVSDPAAYGIALVTVLPTPHRKTAEAPAFSLDQSAYPSAEILYLKSGTQDADIRYTTDGSEPTADSPRYVRPIVLHEGTLALYKAKAFKSGLNPSGTVSSLYQIGQVSSAPEGFQLCMYEDGGECYFEGQAVVAYGADGLFNYSLQTDGVLCSSKVLGDPVPGVSKRCFYSTEIPDELPAATLFNGGFEKPATTSARPGPMTNGWVFDSRSGVQHNDGPFEAAPAPQGVQTGYLKTDGGVAGTLRQTVNLAAGTYQLAFKAAKRTSFGGTQSFDVYLDDTVIGSYRPETGEYTLYRTEPFTVESGKHTIVFQATTLEGDNTAFIDDVRITLPAPTEAIALQNAGFETPAAVNGDRLLRGLVSGWSFNEHAGIVRNGSSLGSPASPAGVQAAFLEPGGRFEQKLELPAGVYAVNFSAASGEAQPPALELRVDGTAADTFSPDAGEYRTYHSAFFTVEAGEHNLQFSAEGTAGILFLDQVSIERIEIPATARLDNGNFESPRVENNTGVLVGGTAGWNFSNFSGMIRNGSVFDAASAPEGTQAAYLQTLNGQQGSFSQQVILPPGTYKLEFQAAKRTNFGGPQTFAVYFDEQMLGTYTPAAGSYAPYSTDGFEVTKPGKHLIRFAAVTDSGDNTAFIDDIQILPYEAPAGDLRNAGFEEPGINSPQGTKWNFEAGWRFNTHAGIARNGSVFEQADAPGGTQAAYLLTNEGRGEISQTAELEAGTYTLSFYAARRAYGGQQRIDLSVNDKLVASVTPESRNYTLYRSEPFTIEAGEQVIRFAAGTTEGDNTAFIDSVRLDAYTPPEAAVAENAGFEAPQVTASYGTVWNLKSGWTFNTHAGIARNGSVLGHPDAPEGTQAAYLQTKNGQGSITQRIEFPAGTYKIAFQAARRSFGGQQSFTVSVDGQEIGAFTPASKEAYEPFESEPFTVQPGFHEVVFAAVTTEGDNTAFVDDVRIVTETGIDPDAAAEPETDGTPNAAGNPGTAHQHSGRDSIE